MTNEEALVLKMRAERLKWEGDNLDYDAKEAPLEQRPYYYEKAREKHEEAREILRHLAEAGF